jgi:hypothetical protein
MPKRDFATEAHNKGVRDSNTSKSRPSALGKNYNAPSGRAKEYSKGWNKKK